MKKIILVMSCMTLALMVAAPAFAFELTSESAKVMNNITAYSPAQLNAIMEANGLTLAENAEIPESYEIDNKKSIAYEPADLHSIFTAYGLTLSPEAVETKLGGTDYASVNKDGEIVFGKKSSAYDGKALTAILSAYAVPSGAPAPVPVAAATPAPTPAPAPAPAPAPKPLKTGAPVGAVVDEGGKWTLKADFLFDFDKAVLNPQYYPMLDNVATVISQNPDLDVEIIGHTDSIGTPEYNSGLSVRRAQAVKTYLTNKGIAASRLSVKGMGESAPIASNTTREGRAKNRRVELNPIWR